MAGPSGTTPVLALPYPTPDDNVDVPRDIKALADKLDPMNSLAVDYASLTRQSAVTATANTPIPMTSVERQEGSSLITAFAAGTIQVTKAGIYLLAGFIGAPSVDVIMGVAVQAGGAGAWTTNNQTWTGAGHAMTQGYPYWLNANDKVAVNILGVASASIPAARLIVASR